MAGEDRYRLAAVRDVRARDEKSRKADLSSAVVDARETQGKLDAARARTKAAQTALAAAQTARETQLLAGATTTQLARADLFLARRRNDLAQTIAEETRCEAAHSERQGKVDAARLVLARARADREIIERHFERWRNERKKLADRRED
ncbi:MAG TPA: hypothetical protein VL326_28245 [Kofleriaceae bacterium]|nr:hypothetical protein [Kofleriaceae bacterium]